MRRPPTPRRTPDWTVDADAFETFYREHVDAIERFVARRVGDSELAADLTADVFVAAIEGGAGYREDRGTAVAWLYGIAQRVVAAAQSRRLHAAMERLPDGERAVLELVALDELGIAEAAVALGIAPVTARVRLYRARRRLSDQLQGTAAPAPTAPHRHAEEAAS